MAKRTPNYFLVLLMFAIAASITYWARTRPSQVQVDAQLSAIPRTIGDWTRVGNDSPASQEVLDAWAVDKDEFLSRTYADANGNQMALLVVYKGKGRRDWHLPELCFRGSGYEIVSETSTTVPYAGKQIEAVKLIGQGDTSRQIIVYWFAAGERAESSFSRLQLSMALSRLRPQKYGWTFVRVNSDVAVSDDDTMAAIRRFLSEASNPLVRALSGGDVSASAGH